MLNFIILLCFFCLTTHQFTPLGDLCVDKKGLLVYLENKTSHQLFSEFSVFKGYIDVVPNEGCCLADGSVCLLFDYCLTTTGAGGTPVSKAFLIGSGIGNFVMLPFSSLGSYYEKNDFKVNITFGGGFTFIEVSTTSTNSIPNVRLLSALYSEKTTDSCSYFSRLSASDKSGFVASLTVSLLIGIAMFISFHFVERKTIIKNVTFEELMSKSG